MITGETSSIAEREREREDGAGRGGAKCLISWMNIRCARDSHTHIGARIYFAHVSLGPHMYVR